MQLHYNTNWYSIELHWFNPPLIKISAAAETSLHNAVPRSIARCNKHATFERAKQQAQRKRASKAEVITAGYGWASRSGRWQDGYEVGPAHAAKILDTLSLPGSIRRERRWFGAACVLVFCVRAFFSLLAMASAAASSAIFDNCFMKKNCHSSRALLLTQFVWKPKCREKSRSAPEFSGIFTSKYVEFPIVNITTGSSFGLILFSVGDECFLSSACVCASDGLMTSVSVSVSAEIYSVIDILDFWKRSCHLNDWSWCRLESSHCVLR